MTTVTEAVKRIGGDSAAIEEGDLDAICAEPAIAQRFARMLVEAARSLSPARDWTAEDLREVFEVAMHGQPQHSVRLLEGRYLRKRVREQINLADRYGDTFAMMVLTLVPDVDQAVYSSVLDAATEHLRRTDMVFLYRRRFAILLPRMRDAGLEPIVTRLQNLVAAGAGTNVVERLASAVYPDEKLSENEGRGALDWVEDQLRDEPMDD